MDKFYIILPLLMLGVIVIAMCLGLFMSKHVVKHVVKHRGDKHGNHDK